MNSQKEPGRSIIGKILIAAAVVTIITGLLGGVVNIFNLNDRFSPKEQYPIITDQDAPPPDTIRDTTLELNQPTQKPEKVSNLIAGITPNLEKKKEITLLIEANPQLSNFQMGQIKSALENSLTDDGYTIRSIFRNQRLALNQMNRNGWVEEPDIKKFVDFLVVAEFNVSFRDAEERGRKVCTVLMNLRAINTDTRTTKSLTDNFDGNGKNGDQALSTSLGQISRHTFNITMNDEDNT